MKLEFPENFYWGSATSAHQVEGNNHNDWTEWEKVNAKRLAKEAGKKKWPDYILNPPAGGPNPLQEKNYISGKACDHYNRFRDDFDIAKSLGHNAHRFSIEWSRIEPEEGKFDEKEIEHYRQVISALTAQRIEPFVTLWHWTHPLWFYKRGSWEHPNAEKSFLRFVERIVSEFKNDVRYWIILNEPETYVRHGYIQAIRPPQTRNIFKAFKILKKLVRVQKQSYNLIHQIAGQEAKVGFAEGIVYFEAKKFPPQNYILKSVLEWWRNKLFIPKVKDYCDFIGLNYYLHAKIDIFNFNKKFQNIENKSAVTDMGWEIFPEGIYHILVDLKKFKKPIIITENGLADARDKFRSEFIKGHLQWIWKAIQESVNVFGYLHWSLLDNFEWTDGFCLRFGLVEVDYKTMERKIRNSALEYAKICTNNAIDSNL